MEMFGNTMVLEERMNNTWSAALHAFQIYGWTAKHLIYGFQI